MSERGFYEALVTTAYATALNADQDECHVTLQWRCNCSSATVFVLFLESQCIFRIIKQQGKNIDLNGLILRSQRGDGKKDYRHINGSYPIAGNPKFIG